MTNTSLIEALGIEKLDKTEQDEILKMAEARLEEVLLDTIVDNLSDQQAAEMREAIADEKDMEAKVALIAARVPGLAAKIELALQKEILTLRLVAQK